MLIDFCLHDIRRNGVTAIEAAYINEASCAQSGDEWVLLHAWQEAHYALVVAESVEPGVGVHCRDLLRDEPLFLVDVGFHSTARSGLVLATRVVAPEGMTGGAALSLGVMSAAEQSRFVNRLKTNLPGMDFANLAPEEATELTATIIRTCLRGGAAEKIRYVEAGHVPEAVPSPEALPSTGRISSNDPCPCGSGQKYKRCCGSRRRLDGSAWLG